MAKDTTAGSNQITAPGAKEVAAGDGEERLRLSCDSFGVPARRLTHIKRRGRSAKSCMVERVQGMAARSGPSCCRCCSRC